MTAQHEIDAQSARDAIDNKSGTPWVALRESDRQRVQVEATLALYGAVRELIDITVMANTPIKIMNGIQSPAPYAYDADAGTVKVNLHLDDQKVEKTMTEQIVEAAKKQGKARGGQ